MTRVLGQLERYSLVGLLLITIVVFSVLEPDLFPTGANFRATMASQAVLAVAALAAMIPLLAGQFDLSVGANLGLTAVVFAAAVGRYDVPMGPAMVLAVVVGALVGLINGVLVTRFSIHSLIVTLGMGTFIHGVTLWFSDTQTISGVSINLVRAVIITRFLGVPLAFFYALILAIVIWYVFSYTALGQRLLFVGRGREVARLSGINVDRMRWGCLMVSAFLGALAGVIYAGTIGAADPNSGLTYLLPAFAAAFLGATSIQPGRFNPIGSVIAVYFLVTGITGLSILGVSTFVQDLFYGGALIVAVTLSQIVRGREERLS